VILNTRGNIRNCEFFFLITGFRGLKKKKIQISTIALNFFAAGAVDIGYMEKLYVYVYTKE